MPGRSVVVVEPNPFMAEMQRAVLRSFAVEFVEPESLLDAVLTRTPDLVITEILLRGTDGLELCRRIKGQAETSSVPVIIFSVLNAREEAYEAGADSFLLKPAERGELAGEVCRLTKAAG